MLRGRPMNSSKRGAREVNHLGVLGRPSWCTQRHPRWIWNPSRARPESRARSRLDYLDPTALDKNSVIFGVAAGLRAAVTAVVQAG
jgi:hypothetical protein